MDFLIRPELLSNVITITTTGTNPSVEEIEHEQKFGAVSVSAGSTFQGPPPFSLGNIVLQIRMNGTFIHHQVFDTRTDPLATSKAQAYINEMTTRILNAKNDWDNLLDILNSSQFQA